MTSDQKPNTTDVKSPAPSPQDFKHIPMTGSSKTLKEVRFQTTVEVISNTVD